MKYYPIYVICTLMTLFGCSKLNTPEQETSEKEAISIGAGIYTDVQTIDSRFTRTESNFTQNFDLFLEQTLPAPAQAVERYNAVYQASKYNVTKNSNTLYWDDIGGTTAVVNFQGIYPQNSATTVATTGFEWAVGENQSTESGVIASDLLISNKIIGYTLGQQKTAPAELVFKHMMSKLTFIMKKGDGFTATDFVPSLKIKQLKTKGAVTFSGAQNLPSIAPIATSEADITPYQVSSVVEESGEKTVTFSAIVVSGQEIPQGGSTVLAQITITGFSEPYNIVLPASSISGAIEPGKNYQIIVTVDKTDVKIVVEETAWENVTPQDLGRVGITLSGNETITNSGGLQENASLYMDIANEFKSIFRYNETGVGTGVYKWDNSASQTIYWDDISIGDHLNIKAFLFNVNQTGTPVSADFLTNVENIYTQTLTVNSTQKSIQFSDMKHPMAKINLIIRSPDTDEGVDLTRLLTLNLYSGLKEYSGVTIGDITAITGNYWTVNYTATAQKTLPVITTKTESGFVESTNVFTFYVEPTTVPVNSTLLSFFHRVGNEGDSDVVENTYPLKISSAQVFKANEE
ncbi:fimbrillin family protein, partial [Porphyromonadaceae bacterium OttesenSCG-928-L07]|nr:fimbrillin family protein [Porphyromonadaceae bacterium OttesenSCG-928-L07]